VVVDFIGADKTGRHRYRQEDVVNTMLPYLQELVGLGIRSFVDCTPMYLARDPEVLVALSEKTGINILTNTGQYKEPFLPAETFELTSEELANRWIRECSEGIENTSIKPGFIKTAVNPGILLPIQRKIIEAAAVTSRETGLTIGTHTGFGIPALEIQAILDAFAVRPDKWIFIHAQNETDFDLVRLVAKRGSWIELDGIGENSVEKHLVPLLKLLDEGFEDQVMLSHDAGWYRVGEEPGGKKKPFTFLSTTFIPLLRRYGVTDDVIRKLTVENPARAFSVD
jgi:phosphotriesterase-related protein